MIRSLPRVVIAGTAGDSGKTLVALSLVTVLRRLAKRPVPFKKGPDFVDAAWLGEAAGKKARNLDSFLMGWDGVAATFAAAARTDGISVIEGNRGYMDGVDAAGTHSTAALARRLGAPVVLVIPARKITATAAMLVAGAKAIEPDVRVAGAILNRISGERHARVAREAIEALGVPVVGEIPNLPDGGPLPGRHLGLVTPEEHGRLQDAGRELDAIASKYLDLGAIMDIAAKAEPFDAPDSDPWATAAAAPGGEVTVGVFKDSAFTFYYPENLEALERAGATLAYVSALEDSSLPDVDALMIGGGFPETHAARLAGNESLRVSVREAAARGMPIYAECGGLMYLCRSMSWGGTTYPMAGVIDAEASMHGRPVGHGYVEAVVDGPNPFLEPGTRIRGHEFHYSSIEHGGPSMATAYSVTRGAGAAGGRDGITTRCVLASYVHLHARACPEWAPGIVRAARTFHGMEAARGGKGLRSGARRSK